MKLVLLFAILLAGCATRHVSNPVRHRIPTSSDGSTRFVRAWNEYAQSLNGGVVSLEIWQRVVDAWDSMTRQ